MPPSRRPLGRRLLRAAARLGLRAGPGAELARIDRAAFTAWARVVGTVERALGPEARDAYTDLVLLAARSDRALGRLAAETLPDHLARVDPPHRRDFLRLLHEAISRRPDALGVVVRTLPEVLRRLPPEAARDFLLRGLALQDRGSRATESFLRMETGRGRTAMESLRPGVALADLQRALALYARAHTGEDLAVLPKGDEPWEAAWTDGERIFLPEHVEHFGDARDALFYRVATARCAGYVEFGTFDLDLSRVPGRWPPRRPGENDLERLLRATSSPRLARDLFRIVEDARVERRVVGAYPGIGRDLAAIRPLDLAARPALEELAPVDRFAEALLRRTWGEPPPGALPRREAEAVEAAWRRVRPLVEGEGTVEQVAAALPELLRLAEGLVRAPRGEGGPQPPGEGTLEPPPEEGGAQPAPDLPGPDAGDAAPEGVDPFYEGLRPAHLGTAPRPDRAPEAARRAEDIAHALHGEPDAPDLAALRRLARRWDQPEDPPDLEALLGAAGSGQPDDRPQPEAEEGDPLDPEIDPSLPVHRYPEWDHALADHRPDWVTLRELELEPGPGGFVEEVVARHGEAIRQLRRRFEALRPAAFARTRRRLDGDFLDLEQVIEARVVRRAGGAPPERLYGRHERRLRDVAVAFLVDMSSSTNDVTGAGGRRIIDVEKEALVVAAEAVDAIGDRCAIYGFSGYGRDNVTFYIAKSFEDPYDDRARRRIGAIGWKMENRDGAAIRHATRRLVETGARVRLLVLLSDGRPLDCGCEHYHDRYAQEDTRAALREARRVGVHPFCITVDPRGRDYLERMYGEVGYVVIDRVEALPGRLPWIYRRLTR